MALVYFVFFVFGLVLGSFFNVVGLRVPIGKSIISPGSSCSNCGHKLSSLELIPVFSFLLQRGKCRSCGMLISKQYLLIEILTGILFVFSIYETGFHKELMIALSIISLLIIIVVSDMNFMIIPNRILVFFLFIFSFERILFPLNPWWSSIVGAFGAFVVLLLINLISKGGMGGGDIKLFSVLGIILGWKLTLIAFMLACFSGSFYGLVVLLSGKLKQRNPIPFGPFISFGGLISYFYCENLLEFYDIIFYK
ncbi:prepilin peptidase [Gottfriedia acidiceleris]|uniref:Prepilin peptidase n=1 Tax=Gottfriedia acidiceleris TaxID=371036 RepID=A0ABY4JV75_9BACI|nr:A24 family peptidase [Gottfriedia acidiceleris]UPM56537.1 prepilin peptidase [Gottfriedia acidiceleris]